MKANLYRALAIGVIILLGSARAPGRAAMEADPSPVVIELFTSQGCSSCPPADVLLGKLVRAPAEGATVIPLAYHVDYWNYLGWRDPFSRAEWTERQRAYAGHLGDGRVYTPQAVINGRMEMVGSDEKSIKDAIAKALAQPPAARIMLELHPVADRTDSILVSVGVMQLAGKADGWFDVMLAVYENGRRTPVRAGENAGRVLHNDFTVRRLVRAFTWRIGADAQMQQAVQIMIENDWDKDQIGFAAFVQASGTLEIHGAAVLTPPLAEASALADG